MCQLSFETKFRFLKKKRVKSRFFFCNNAPAHDDMIITRLKLLDHTPYSLYLTLCDFTLFFSDEVLLRAWDSECAIISNKMSQMLFKFSFGGWRDVLLVIENK